MKKARIASLSHVSREELQETIINLMKSGNLDDLTVKKIRNLCEKKYRVDLSSRKDEIDNVVMSFIENHSGKEKRKKLAAECDDSSSYGSSCSSQSCSSGSECSSASYSGSGSSSSDEEAEEKVPVPPKPAPMKKAKKTVKAQAAARPAPQPSPRKQVAKKTVGRKDKPAAAGSAAAAAAAAAAAIAVRATGEAKKSKGSPKMSKMEMDDAAIARQLQAEEWNFRQGTTRNLFRSPPPQRKPKATKAEKSDEKKPSPLLRKCLLSPELAEVLGTEQMSRPDIVQKMWSIAKQRDLFDPSNKQFIICDEQLERLFGKSRVRLMGMMKFLKNHITDMH